MLLFILPFVCSLFSGDNRHFSLNVWRWWGLSLWVNRYSVFDGWFNWIILSIFQTKYYKGKNELMSNEKILLTLWEITHGIDNMKFIFHHLFLKPVEIYKIRYESVLTIPFLSEHIKPIYINKPVHNFLFWETLLGG